MPIYNYGCQTCDHRFQITAKMSDPVLVHCPQCGQDSLKKLVSKTGFRLKGGGWYDAGYASTSSSSSTSSNDDSSE
jgi:putative FmdB family regulatory protein